MPHPSDFSAIEPDPATGHQCPLCRNELRRTWRRPVDKFASLFLPLHRYRCGNFSCQWEGNFRVQGAGRKGAKSSAGTRPVLKPVSAKIPAMLASGTAMVGVFLVLVVLLVGSQWEHGASWAGSKAMAKDSVASTSLVPSAHGLIFSDGLTLPVASTSLVPSAYGQEIPVGPRRGPGVKPP